MLISNPQTHKVPVEGKSAAVVLNLYDDPVAKRIFAFTDRTDHASVRVRETRRVMTTFLLQNDFEKFTDNGSTAVIQVYATDKQKE